MDVSLSQIILFGMAFVAMFATTFLRGFQNKNVTGGHKRLAFCCGALMTALEGVVILMLAKSGPELLAFTALGSGVGWVAGMRAHDKLMHKRVLAAKKAKKTKRRARIEAIAAELVEERLKSIGVI